MIFYEIEMLSVPRIEFACSVEYDKYRNCFYNREDFLEISVCEEGRVLFEHADGRQELAVPRMLIPIVSDICCETRAYREERQRHTTVGVVMKYRAVRYFSETECDISALGERLRNGQTILIPYHMDMGEEFDDILYRIRKIVGCYFSNTPGGQIEAVAQWYALTGKLTAFVYEQLNETKKEIPPSERRYVSRAVQYISEHYMERLTVGEIASHLGISEGYLHRVFRNVNGMGVLEFINRRRISIALELIRAKQLTLAEAAYNVGINDPAYMSRLFKKTTGMSYRSYWSDRSTKIE
ncbi:MAG: helix-turn-helix transcriptional regulator [Clostridia bacterium]|nr:helix-turn-helix transcriptional regulator [Clostridia bacterium]